MKLFSGIYKIYQKQKVNRTKLEKTKLETLIN